MAVFLFLSKDITIIILINTNITFYAKNITYYVTNISFHVVAITAA